MKKFLIPIYLAIFLFFILTFFSSTAGNIGLRPMTNGCFGLKLSSDFVHAVFPDGRYESGNLAYYVDREVETGLDTRYCLGRDIWYGEL